MGDTPSHPLAEGPAPESTRGGLPAPSVRERPASLRPRAGTHLPLAGTQPGSGGTCLHLFSRFFTSAPRKHEVEGHDRGGRKEKK